jgi:hypothetical protein
VRSIINNARASRFFSQHFYQLTQSFMNPFEQYFATLLPLQRQIVPWKTIPRLKPFSKKAFLASLPETFRCMSRLLETGLGSVWAL